MHLLRWILVLSFLLAACGTEEEPPPSDTNTMGDTEETSEEVSGDATADVDVDIADKSVMENGACSMYPWAYLWLP